MSDVFRRSALAERAARAGGTVARQEFRDGVAAETKADGPGLVTQADRDVQRQVVATILEEYPEDALVCEETVQSPAGPAADPDILETLPETGPAWVVDPIDGTDNYRRGIPLWTTSIAAVDAGEAVGAATYLPATGDLYAASPDSVTRDGAGIAVSDCSDAAAAVVGVLGRWPAEGPADAASAIRAAGERFGDFRRFGSMQAALAFVADGSLDAAFVPVRPAPWDAIAGAYLVERAGGTVTDVHGDPWSPTAEGLVVSNGDVHDATLAAARAGLE